VLSSGAGVLVFAMLGPVLVALAPAPAPIEATGDGPTIVWTPAPGCPDAAALRSRVERLIGRPLHDGAEAVEVTARVTHGETFALALRVRSDTGIRERTITAPDCEALVEIAAVVIAVAVDPSASLLPEPEPAPEPEPPQTTTPPQRAAIVAPPRPRRSPRRRSRPTGTLGALAGVGLGIVPGPTAVVGGGGGVRWPHARLDLAVEHAVTRTARLDGGRGVEVRVLAARAHGCWVPTVGRVLEFPLCAGVAAGVAHGRGFGVPRGETRRAPWVGLHAQAGVWIAPLAGRRWFAFGPMVRLQAPLVRPAFTLDGFGVAYRTHAAGFVAGLAVELRFP
jgi:hypothetical protein